MTGQNDRQDESLTGQALDQAGHCPLTGRYFEPCTCGENGPCYVKNVLALSLVRINIDSFVALVLRKFPCFLEIDILFILNYKSGTKLAKRGFIPRATKDQTHLSKI